MDPPSPFLCCGFHRMKMPVSGQKGDSQCCETLWRQAGNTSPMLFETGAEAELRKDQDLGSHLFVQYPRKVWLPTRGRELCDGGAAPLGPAGTSGSRHLACGCSPCVRFGVCLEKCAARTITPRTGEGRAARARWLQSLSKGKYFSLYILANPFYLAPKFTAAFAFLL